MVSKLFKPRNRTNRTNTGAADRLRERKRKLGIKCLWTVAGRPTPIVRKWTKGIPTIENV